MSRLARATQQSPTQVKSDGSSGGTVKELISLTLAVVGGRFQWDNRGKPGHKLVFQEEHNAALLSINPL